MICACPCKKEFEPRRPNQKYSSPKCKERARQQRRPNVRVTSEEKRFLDRSRIAQTAVVPRGNHPFPGYRATRRHQALYGPLTLLNEFEASELLGVKVGTLRYWRRRRVRTGPPFIKMGALVRYRLRGLERYLRKVTVRTARQESK